MNFDFQAIQVVFFSFGREKERKKQCLEKGQGDTGLLLGYQYQGLISLYHGLATCCQSSSLVSRPTRSAEPSSLTVLSQFDSFQGHVGGFPVASPHHDAGRSGDRGSSLAEGFFGNMYRGKYHEKPVAVRQLKRSADMETILLFDSFIKKKKRERKAQSFNVVT